MDSEYILKNYKQKSNKEIGDHLGLTPRQVWSRAKKLGLVNPQKPVFDLTDNQQQIILSGIIGDGGIKKNGSYGSLYRECHAIDEEGYLLWKYNSLCPLTKTTKITDIAARNLNQLPQKYFNTVTTPSLNKFSTMKRSQIIKDLKELGLLLLLLDDGWARRYSETTISIHLSVISLSAHEKELLLSQYQNILDVDVWMTNKDKNIAFSVDSTIVLYKTILKYMDKETDILQKKFAIYY